MEAPSERGSRLAATVVDSDAADHDCPANPLWLNFRTPQGYEPAPAFALLNSKVLLISQRSFGVHSARTLIVHIVPAATSSSSPTYIGRARSQRRRPPPRRMIPA